MIKPAGRFSGRSTALIELDELDEAIAECERARPTMQTCEKLAVFYTLKDHLTGAEGPFKGYSGESGATLSLYGESPFMRLIQGRETASVIAVMDELMTALSVLNPGLYNNVLNKIKGGG